MSEKRQRTATWLASLGQLESVTSAELEQLRMLLDHAGFPLLWAQVAFLRSSWAAQLAQLPLVNEANIARASVLQGQLAAVDALREIMLDIADPPEGDVADPTAQLEQEIYDE